MVFSLSLKKNHFGATCPPKQMTVQRGCQPFAWHKVRGNDCESAKKQDGLSAKEPEGKEGNSSHIWKGNELGCEAARRKHWRHCMFLQHLLVTVSLWGKGRFAFPPLLPPSIILVCLSSLLPPCQQRCATVAERPISIIELMNTEWPQVVMIKKIQRLQTVIFSLSSVREGFLGKQARGKGGIRWIGIIYVSFLNYFKQRGCGCLREWSFFISFQTEVKYKVLTPERIAWNCHFLILEVLRQHGNFWHLESLSCCMLYERWGWAAACLLFGDVPL